MVGLGVLVFSILIGSAHAENTHNLVSAEVQNYVQLSNYNPFVDADHYNGWTYYRQVCHQTLNDLAPSVSAPIQSVFKNLQSRLFGADLFKIKLCFMDAIATDIQESTIYVDPIFISRLVESLDAEKLEPVLAVLLGHELGHYLYEEILISSTTSQSALGHSISWFNIGLLESSRDPAERFLIHGEIDAIGFDLAQRAGYDISIARTVLDDVESVLGGSQIPGKSIRQSVIDAYLAR